MGAGKAHIVVLTSNHEVFTFGMNNKGQCGREFPAGPGPVIGGGQLGNNDHEEAEVEDHEAEHDMEITAAAGQVILTSYSSILLLLCSHWSRSCSVLRVNTSGSMTSAWSAPCVGSALDTGPAVSAPQGQTGTPACSAAVAMETVGVPTVGRVACKCKVYMCTEDETGFVTGVPGRAGLRSRLVGPMRRRPGASLSVTSSDLTSSREQVNIRGERGRPRECETITNSSRRTETPEG